MIDKEEIEILNKKIELLDEEDFYYVWNNKERDIVKKLIKENIRLEEVEKEHQKQVGELIQENNKLKEIIEGKSVQELGMSDLYKED